MSDIYIFLDYSIDCSHWLPNVPDGHKCGRMHGHRYEIRLEIGGDVDPVAGWIIDYAEVKEVFDPIIMGLDHRCLNDIQGLENPTCENIVLYLQRSLRHESLRVSAIEIRETARAGAGWRGQW